MNKVAPSITIPINYTAEDNGAPTSQTSTVNYRLSELGFTQAYEESNGTVLVINEGGNLEPLNLNKVYERGHAKFTEDRKAENVTFSDDLLTAGEFGQASSTAPDFGDNPPPPGGAGSWGNFVSDATYDGFRVENAKATAMPNKRK